MKQLVLSLAVVAMAGSAASALPFYSPNQTYDITSGAGNVVVLTAGISPDGKAASYMSYWESNVNVDRVSTTWRGQSSLPTPMEDSDHLSPQVRDINRHGWISGFTKQSNNGGAQPAVWRPDGTRIDLPPVPSPFPGEPTDGDTYDINDAGFVVGKEWKDDKFGMDFGDRPVYWTPSYEIVELPNPFATTNGYWGGHAASISSNGIIAGTVYLWSTAVWRAMRWDIDGTAPILSQTTDTGITFTKTEAYMSLDDGTIVGRGISGSKQAGILWMPNGEAIELRNLPDSTSQVTLANEVNRNHYSVGAGQNSLGLWVGVRWSLTGEPSALDRMPDTPSDANDLAEDINDFNFVVGGSYVGSTYYRALLWTPDGDAIDMNSLVESDEWSLTQADAITNTGWISGIGYFDPDGPLEEYRRPFSILVPFAGTYGLGDANFDESIDFADLLIVAQHYGSSTGGSVDAGDFNLDGVVDFTDLLAIAQHYGQSVSSLNVSGDLDFNSDWQRAQAMVPEPSVMGVMIGALVMLRRR